ncbi:helix-turn-helix transcriptional regulator [Streptomyces sp. NPDC006622]|uniref:helix-turn-helix domain-containing protein n=1 Tax=Streptomyces sp. NPDC006622 TaxID=3155459 RepID=UPI0033B22F9F
MSTGDGAGEVAEFAALLTELKERTGRSYGSLARRLGMNTSTLHRYCAGEAVPQDFAPVERLAQFSGATPEERLELHRRWLRTVAVRQAGRPRAGAATPTATATVPETGPAAVRHEPTGEAATAAEAGAAEPESRAGAGTLVAAGPAQDPFAEAEPAGGGEGTATADAGRGDGALRSNETGTGGGSVPVGGPRRPWYRRRRTALLAAVACTLVTTLGTLSALPADRPSASPTTSAAPSVSAPARTTAPAAPRPSPTASPSRSPSPAPGSASSASGPREPSRSAPAAPAGPAPQDTTVPLSWTADSQAWALGCGHDYVIAEPPARVAPPPAAQDAAPWAASQGAVHGRETEVEISVQGRGSTAVVLTALRVRVVGRAGLTPGNAYAMDRGCGGSITPRYFAVDLDRERPIARPVAGDDTGTAIPAVRMPYRVSAENPEVLLVTARTEGCDCSWYLELAWSSGGRTGTVRVDDHGRPFRTRSIAGLPRYVYDTSARRWTPYR